MHPQAPVRKTLKQTPKPQIFNSTSPNSHYSSGASAVRTLIVPLHRESFIQASHTLHPPLFFLGNSDLLLRARAAGASALIWSGILICIVQLLVALVLSTFLPPGLSGVILFYFFLGGRGGFVVFLILGLGCILGVL